MRNTRTTRVLAAFAAGVIVICLGFVVLTLIGLHAHPEPADQITMIAIAVAWLALLGGCALVYWLAKIARRKGPP